MSYIPWETEADASLGDHLIGSPPEDALSFVIRPQDEIGLPATSAPNYVAIDLEHPDRLQLRDTGREWRFRVDERAAELVGFGVTSVAPPRDTPPDRLPGWVVAVLNYAGYRLERTTKNRDHRTKEETENFNIYHL